MFTGQEEFHSELSATLDYLMTQTAAIANASVSNVPPAAAPQASQDAAAVQKATNATATSFHKKLDEMYT